MSKDINNYVCTGRLTKDPILSKTKSDVSVVSASLAINGYKENSVTFLDVKFWEKTAEIVCQYMKKGSPMAVTGRLEMESWEKDGTKRSKIVLVAESVKFIGTKEAGTQSANWNMKDEPPQAQFEEPPFPELGGTPF